MTKRKPKAKMSFREKVIRWLGGVPAPKPTKKKPVKVKATVRAKPANGKDSKPVSPSKTANPATVPASSEVEKVDAGVQKVLDYAGPPKPVNPGTPG